MKISLKILYKYLIENQKHEIEEWHDSYRDFFKKVNDYRNFIKKGGHLPKTNDKIFLRKLLKDDNGITSRGQSILSDINFDKLINNDEFIQALENFIKDTYHPNYQKFKTTWEKVLSGEHKTPLLVNRVAASCTHDVSTTADEVKFNQVLNWLIEKKIIDKKIMKIPDWYLKNLYLMEKIHEEFESEINKGITNEYYLSMFVCKIYENIYNPFSLKKQIIKYGYPGTGKTYKAKRQTEILFDLWKNMFDQKSKFTHSSQIEIIQFHPSFSYEDFIEGLRPILDKNNNAQLTLQNGIFKEFCRKAGKWEILPFQRYL